MGPPRVLASGAGGVSWRRVVERALTPGQRSRRLRPGAQPPLGARPSDLRSSHGPPPGAPTAFQAHCPGDKFARELWATPPGPVLGGGSKPLLCQPASAARQVALTGQHSEPAGRGVGVAGRGHLAGVPCALAAASAAWLGLQGLLQGGTAHPDSTMPTLVLPGGQCDYIIGSWLPGATTAGDLESEGTTAFFTFFSWVVLGMEPGPRDAEHTPPRSCSPSLAVS